MPGQFVALKGFTPDLDPTTPGTIVAVEMLVPTLIGLKGAASTVPVAGLPPLPDVCTGAATIQLLTGTLRALAGTPTAIYEATSHAWVDVTRQVDAIGSQPPVPLTGQPVTFSLAVPPANGVSYSWDMGDGTAAQDTDVPSVTYTYAASGSYTVTCTATLSDTTTQVYTLSAVVSDPPSITAVPASPVISTAVTFTLVNPPAAAKGYTWDYGDGSTPVGTTAPEVSYYGYTSAGDYEVTCTVTMQDGSTTQASLTLTVSATVAFARLRDMAAGDPLNAHMEPRDASTDTQVTKPYDGTKSNVWRFAQMGNATLAVNGADVIQQSVTAGPFADIPGAPVADLIDVTQGFVFVANVTDPVYGSRPDGWWCSGLYDQTIWTPDIATQCATARLIDTPGENTACRALGSNIVIYKASSFYYGTYQGPPIIWGFTVVSNQVGVPTQEAVISIGSAHIFRGNDNFYIYDGTRPQPIGDTVKQWFFADCNPAQDYHMASMHDHTNALVYWFYVSNDSPDGQTIDHGIVYNYRSNQWGHVAYPMEAVFDYVVGQLTWDDLGDYWDTWDDLPAVAYDSPFWLESSRVPTIVDTTNTVQTLTGATVTSTLQTGVLGNDEAFTDLQYVRIRCRTDPASATMVAWHRDQLGNSSQQFSTTTATMHDDQFDVDASARWHSMAFTFQGDVEILGMTPTAVQDGLR